MHLLHYVLSPTASKIGVTTVTTLILHQYYQTCLCNDNALVLSLGDIPLGAGSAGVSRGSLASLQAHSGTVSRLRSDNFLPDTFESTSHSTI
jgi:hypothetical protein